MKHVAIIVGGALLLTGTATAADLSWNSGAAATPFYSSSSAFNWSGFYAGVNGGYGFGENTREASGGGPELDTNTDGWSLGATVGYNMDMGSGFIVGVEADGQWASIGFEEDIGPGTTFESKVDAYGTLRGRAGMALDRVMPYVTAGVAVGKGSMSTTDAANVVTSQSTTHLGWTVGAGLEAAATDNLTLKAEYLYVDLGTQTYSGLPGGSVDGTQRFSVVRAGMNYKF
jgi:outer membrane immunogenic protein